MSKGKRGRPKKSKNRKCLASGERIFPYEVYVVGSNESFILHNIDSCVDEHCYRTLSLALKAIIKKSKSSKNPFTLEEYINEMEDINKEFEKLKLWVEEDQKEQQLKYA